MHIQYMSIYERYIYTYIDTYIANTSGQQRINGCFATLTNPLSDYGSSLLTLILVTAHNTASLALVRL